MQLLQLYCTTTIVLVLYQYVPAALRQATMLPTWLQRCSHTQFLPSVQYLPVYSAVQ